MRMYGLTQRELARQPTGPLFLDRLARADISQFQLPPGVPDLRDYIDHAVRSGFPEALLRLSGTARQAWLDSYLDQLLTHDAQGLLSLRDPARLRRYFEAVALHTAGLAEHQTLYTAAGIDRHTALAYDQLLMNLFVLDQLPAWTSNRLSRLIKTPKRYLVDPALVTAALRLDTAAILRDSDLLGRILDTFVMAQIRPEVEVSPLRPRLYHLRDMGGRREIDVVGEVGTGVVGIEIKATAAPASDDAAHLTYLRDQLGERFLAGAVLHTGPALFALSDRVYALPVCTLWA
jgi:predicted AAA+ superfamily ATPase